ncbi:MAG: GNAT family N-acetyltransferase [Ginsengibacter sp.]
MNVTIRKAKPEDFFAVLELNKEFSVFQKTPEKVSITLEQMKSDANLFQCFIAENDACDIVGFASFFFAYYSWTGKALYLDDLYVKEAYRKHKVGSDLLNTIIGHAKKENCTKMRWQVSRWNNNAIEFYKKMGAEIEETEINCDLKL